MKNKLWKSESIDFQETGKPVAMEIGTQIEIMLEDPNLHAKSDVIGMEPGSYIIIKTPNIRNTTLSQIYPGTDIIVQYLHQGTVFGFKSDLRGIVSVPAKVMFISYPKMIFRYDLRSQKRMECFLPSKLVINGEEQAGVIRDISRDGCRCVIKAARGGQFPHIEIEKIIMVHLQLPGVAREPKLQGKVKNIQCDVHEMTLGIQFHQVTAGAKKQIVDYISTVEPF
jgi:c-di-GMP-binding flagellar brake protein YcgR